MPGMILRSQRLAQKTAISPSHSPARVRFVVKGQFPVGGIFRAGGILDNKKLLSRNYLFNFTATFSPTNNGISTLSENSTDWKSALIGILRNHDGNGDCNAKLLLFQNFRFKRFLAFRSNSLPMRDSEVVLFNFTPWKPHFWRSVLQI